MDPAGLPALGVRPLVVLQKPNLRRPIRPAHQVGAVGVNVAHSGTLTGLLFDHGAVDQADVTNFVRRRVEEAKVVGWHRVIGGGPPRCIARIGANTHEPSDDDS